MRKPSQKELDNSGNFAIARSLMPVSREALAYLSEFDSLFAGRQQEFELIEESTLVLIGNDVIRDVRAKSRQKIGNKRLRYVTRAGLSATVLGQTLTSGESLTLPVEKTIFLSRPSNRYKGVVALVIADPHDALATEIQSMRNYLFPSQEVTRSPLHVKVAYMDVSRTTHDVLGWLEDGAPTEVTLAPPLPLL